MNLVRLIALLITGTALFAQSSLDQAWELAGKGQGAAAIAILKELVRKEPGNADAHALLGSLLMEAGDRINSIAQLTEAVRLQPRSADAQNALGEAYIKFGDSKAARAPLEKAVALNPKFAVAELNLGQVLAETKDLTASASHLERAILLFGRSDEAADAHYLRAKVYAAQDAPAQAMKELEKATAQRPDFAEAWSDLGQARKLLLDDEGALAAFARAVKLNPENAISRYRLGAEYLRQRKSVEAVKHLEEAYRLNPEDQSTLNALQMALRQAGRADEAKALKQKLADQFAKRDQANQDALSAVKLNNEGAELEKAGNLQAALENYRKARSLYPQHTGIRLNYAVALLKLGQWKEGLNELHEALLREPANPQIQAAWRDALAQAPPVFRIPYDQP